ncbi:MAG: hypothetical protein ABFC89_09965 [Methanospirillum sp.]
MEDDKPIAAVIQEERLQNFATRKALYKKINKQLGKPLVAYVTSFTYPVMIDNKDADMLEAHLQKLKLDDGFVLLISSPGGDGLTAERIINICRAYSKSGDFITIVPGKAKSAATMICLGSSKIMMSKTSELGPIDPQFLERGPNGESRVYSVYNIVKSYKKIFDKAEKTQGKIEPYLQALSRYDSWNIEECLSQLELSQDIGVKALKTGMLRDDSEDEIANKIKRFLIPDETKVHARPIYYDDVKSCDLIVELVPVDTPLWKNIYELYMRLEGYVSNNGIAKCIESEKYSFVQTYQRNEAQ